MTDDSMNSAEREAEEVLKAEFSKIQAELCPQGRECAVHFRVDDAYMKEDIEYARYITYVGDYAVITDDNPGAHGVALLVGALLGVEGPRADRYETVIMYVGSGALGDILPEDLRQALRYRVTHDDWPGLKALHEATVSALEAGLIDVSKPVED